MKNVYEVLRQKELAVSRLQKEVAALRVVGPILSEDSETGNDDQPTPSSTTPQAINTVHAIDDTPQQAGAPAWGSRVKHWLTG